MAPTKQPTKMPADRTNRAMWIARFALVALYHSFLHQVFGSGQSLQDFKFYSFLIVTPVVKFFFQFRGCKTRRSQKEFALSVVGDAFQCTLLWKVIFVYCRGNWFFLYPFLQAFAILGMEVVCFLVLDKGSDDPTKNRYVIKLSKNPLDYTLMIIVGVVQSCTSLAISTDYTASPSGIHVVALALLLMQGELSFGVLHYLCHRIPRFWRSHKVHHEYKQGDLNSLANFYSDLPDGISMNCSLIGACVLAHAAGGPFTHPMIHPDYLFPALYSHSKYNTLFLSSLCFYELDLLSLVTGEQRITEYHNHHHQDSSEHFCVFGLYPDWLIKRLVDPFLATAPQNPGSQWSCVFLPNMFTKKALSKLV